MAQWLELLSEPPLPPPNKLPFAACAPSRATLSCPYVHPGLLGLHLERSRPRPLSWGPPKDTTSLFSLAEVATRCPGRVDFALEHGAPTWEARGEPRAGLACPLLRWVGRGRGQLALQVSVPGWLVAPGPLRSKRPPPWASFLAQSQTLWGAMAGEAGGQLGPGRRPGVALSQEATGGELPGGRPNRAGSEFSRRSLETPLWGGRAGSCPPSGSRFSLSCFPGLDTSLRAGAKSEP